jgi:hypothetical protein
VTGKVIQKHLIFALVFENLPKVSWLFPIFFCYVGGIGMYLADPFAVCDIGRTALDLTERRSDCSR